MSSESDEQFYREEPPSPDTEAELQNDKSFVKDEPSYTETEEENVASPFSFTNKDDTETNRVVNNYFQQLSALSNNASVFQSLQILQRKKVLDMLRHEWTALALMNCNASPPESSRPPDHSSAEILDEDGNPVISDDDLATLSVRELNARLRKYSGDKQLKFKQLRRTLKNRAYAQACRVRRQQEKNFLQKEVKRLLSENNELKDEIKKLGKRVVELEHVLNEKPSS